MNLNYFSIVRAILILAFTFVPSFSYGQLVEGHYQLVAPAIITEHSGPLTSKLMYLKRIDDDDFYLETVSSGARFNRLKLHQQGESIRLTGKVRDGYSADPMTANGRVLDNNTVSGTLYWSVWIIPYEIKVISSEWHLRPASEQEIYEYIINGLSKRLTNSRIKYLGGEGAYATYTDFDTPEKIKTFNGSLHYFKNYIDDIKAKLQSGAITFDAKTKQFSFSDPQFIEKLSTQTTEVPISPKVETEYNPMTIEELTEMGVIEANMPDEDIEKLRKNLEQEQAVLANKRRAKQEPPISAEVQTMKINIPLVLGGIVILIIFLIIRSIRKKRN